MPMAIAEPVAGHRAKFELLSSHLPPEQAANEFVGGGDAVLTGFKELEALRRFKNLKNASIMDIGCGIGRLTNYLHDEGLARYIGLDIIPEILQIAIDGSKNFPTFKFGIVEEAKLPAEDSTFDIVCGFSLITHLLDEEIFEYFLESNRVLRAGGVAIFSFSDLDVPFVRERFFQHARQHRHGHGDLNRFMTRPVLDHFAHGAGFSSVQFIDGQENIVTEMRRSHMIDGRETPPSGMLGQSICVMTA